MVKKIILLLLILSYSAETYGQAKNCSGGGGIYSALLLNPGAQDGDDGNLDGNCEYMLTLTLFSVNSPVTFVYTGDGTATPSSAMVSFTSAGQVTVVSPCATATVAAFDVFFMGNLECQLIDFNLPVELSKFELESTTEGIILSWETSSELNNEGFFIERSTDGVQWQTLDFVSGHGTTQQMQSYTYADKALFPGNRFYRLKQIDFDGSFEYSFIQNIYFEGNPEKPLTIFPNPVSDRLQVQLGTDEQIQRIQVFDQYGRLAMEATAGAMNLDVSTLSAGAYLLRIQGSQRVYQARFVHR